MASSCKFLFLICIAVIYCTKSNYCLPAREARMPAPSLERICRDSAANPVVKSHRLFCFLCKGFDISCFTSTTTASPPSSSPTSSSPTSSSPISSSPTLSSPTSSMTPLPSSSAASTALTTPLTTPAAITTTVAA